MADRIAWDGAPRRHLTRLGLAAYVVVGLAFWALLFWIGYALWPVLP
jgi:hypothetical protein